MSKLLLIGNFGYANNTISGQAIRSQNIKKLIKQEGYEYQYLDTSILKVNPFKIINKIPYIFSCDKYILIFAQNNLKFFFPPLFMLSLIMNKDIIYISIGGWLYEFVKDKYFLSALLKRVKIVFVQTNGLKEKMKSLKYNNIKLLPNFKVIDYKNIKINQACNLKKGNNTLNLVFMSRVTKAKGLDIIDELFSHELKGVYLDIYGPVDSVDQEYLNAILNKYATIKYKGILAQEDLHRVLSLYDYLFFPSHYEGEGQPGSILDAYIAGVPVIASNWKYNKEFVTDGVTGFIFELNQIEDLLMKINKAKNPNVAFKMKSRIKTHLKNNFDYKVLSKPLLEELN